MDLTIPVTLIVKAPNQQIEDQTVKCELTWTISRLKGHLSEVYPSKPASHEQKLIYSGQLLPDTVVLKDILRNYDGQDTHTVHLVCAPSKNKPETPKMQEPKTSNDSQPQNVNPDPVSNIATSTTGLHHRNITHLQETSQPTGTTPMTDYRTLWASTSQMYSNQYFSDPSQYALQAALMQQAYVQYINQYMQMVSNQRLAEQQREPEPVAPQEPANLEPAQDEHDGEDAQADRDWLDWFYVISRIMILFCIVYFYSSPLRFALVLILGIGLYLYQTGFFRPPAVINNNAPRPENNNVQQNAETSSNQNNVNNQPVVDQRPTMLNIMWTFFTTFFASLIPEIPNAV